MTESDYEHYEATGENTGETQPAVKEPTTETQREEDEEKEKQILDATRGWEQNNKRGGRK